MFGADDAWYDKLCEAKKKIEDFERERESMRKALGAMEQHDMHHAEIKLAEVFTVAKKAVQEALWPGPLTELMKRRRELEEELSKVIGLMDSPLDHKGKAMQVILDCNRGNQNCSFCPIITCCDNDTDAARLIRELASASDIGRNRLVEMIWAASKVMAG